MCGVWAVCEGAGRAQLTTTYQLQHKHIGAKKAAVVGLADVWVKIRPRNTLG